MRVKNLKLLLVFGVIVLVRNLSVAYLMRSENARSTERENKKKSRVFRSRQGRDTDVIEKLCVASLTQSKNARDATHEQQHLQIGMSRFRTQNSMKQKSNRRRRKINMFTLLAKDDMQFRYLQARLLKNLRVRVWNFRVKEQREQIEK